MIHKTTSPQPNHVRVVFELPSCIWADRIFLVGDFNKWSATATPMRQNRDGVWRATLDLPQGSRYEYRYLIDGQWKTDCHADDLATNSHGSENSVVNSTLPVAPILGRANNVVWNSPNLAASSTMRPPMYQAR